MPSVKGFVYVYLANHIPVLLDKIQQTGKPDKLTITHVQKNWLIKDAKYSAVLELLREMNFLDPNGVPTQLYSEYQNQAKAKVALGKGVVNAYPSLFKTYPKANELDNEHLKGFVKEHTGAEERTVQRIVKTITTLCSLASFGDSSVNSDPVVRSDSDQVPPNTAKVNVRPSLQLNIEIHIAPEMTEDKIESIFKNMKKYLLTSNE